jgi:hypothetical protein
MKKNIFRILLSVLSFNALGQVVMPPDSTYFYNQNGTKNWWYVQKDVFLYRMNSGASYTMAVNATIDASQYLNATVRKQNRIKFNSAASAIQKALVINSVSTAGGFESASPAVSKVKNVAYATSGFNETNDLILVRFAPNALNTATALTGFMNRNNLALFHQPFSNLPNPDAWTFIFKINKDAKGTPYSDVFTVCQYVSTNEIGFVKNCEPDMKMFEPSGCEIVNEFANNTTSGTPDGLWHIRNQGQVAFSTFSGLAGSDAKICECWGEGYHGENVKVAVIDNYGYDFSHPEMIGQFLNGWDCVSNPPNGLAITTTTYISNNSHGMEVASVIAAKANNNSNYNTVGVAYNSRILPYIVDGNSGTAIMAIQKAVADGADIINMSFGNPTASSATYSPLYTEVDNAKLYGRGGLGCFVVASTGNNNVNGKFFPAADFNVFGVGATDASDYRGVVPTWGWSGGSNYLIPLNGEPARYNVVAPGTRIYTSWTQTPLTTPTYVQSQQNGTSFSAPIVSGIGAIILSKNPNLTVAQVEAAIQNNTDQIRPATYGNYNLYPFLPGYTDQTFYGRVNCIKALNTVPVGIREYYKADIGIKFIRFSENEVGVFFDKDFNNKGCILNVYDITGKLLTKTVIDPNLASYMLNTDNYVQGMYIITVSDREQQNGQAFKFIK